jgi:tetratricopeptide (TPR) repeat protein
MRTSLLLLLFSVIANAQPSWREQTLEANRLREAAHYQQAEEAYKAALNQAQAFPAGDPRRAESLNNLGALYYSTGSYAAAEPLYREAIGSRSS